MTLALALSIAAASAPITVVQYPIREAEVVVLEAVVTIPAIGLREQIALDAVAGCILEGTEDYSSVQFRRWGSQTGRPPLIERMPGYLRFSLSMPKDQVSTGISMLDSMLRRAQFTKESLDKFEFQVRGSSADYWASAIWPYRAKVRDLRTVDVVDAYRRWVRPENVTLGIGGSFTAEDVQKLRSRLADWPATRPQRTFFDSGEWIPTLSNRTSITTIEIRMPELRPTEVNFPAKLAAIYAIGVGKGSLLFRLGRAKDGFSYRQEAMLWPTPLGFEGRMILARKEASFDVSKVDDLRVAMHAEVDAWTETDLVRAVGLADSSIRFGIGYPLIHLGSRGPIGDTIEDQTILRTFWMSRSKSEWSPDRLVEDIKKTSLGDLKSIAKSMLQNAKSSAILGMSNQN